ncbi:NADP-dependent oxidoreductase [Amycolatopsis minnesotensis]|uniref:NADP-dependent oxidoreductase n=1 Tax=Amycolatopsis minnesotensis TaxID=337894 RepID=A0ABP5CT71_9PSEU
MKAAAFTTPGPPENLVLTEVDEPRAGEGQVRVRVMAAGVQPFDAAFRAGWEPPMATLTWPRIPGNEFAGVIDQVGGGVTTSGIGDEVLGFTVLNACAEYIVVSADHVTPKPAEMPWEVAGGFTAGAQTAYNSLDALAVGAGDTLVVHAAAGSVGTFAVQLAKLRGANVIGTASEANQEYLRGLGATPVVYGVGLLDRLREAAPEGIDAALDGAGGAALDASLELVQDRNRIVTLVEHGKAAGLGIQTAPAIRTAARLGEIAALYAAGKVAVHIRRTFPLAEAAAAHREIETGHGRGKLVLVVSGG